MIYFLIFTLALGCLLATVIYGLCRYMDIPMPWEVKWHPELDELKALGREPRFSPTIRKCPGCGEEYHKSWGMICPDCSGAD